MATPSDSPVEEVMFEIEPSRVPKPIPVALEDLCRLTKFTRQEIRIMYRGFKTVGLILGIAGACRTDELVNLTVDDIEDVGSSLIVKIPNTKTKIPRTFVVTDVGNMLELFRKYLSLRPPHVKHKRLFLYYKAGKCSSQPVGKNTMGKIRSVVASYLKLPDAACYTGHCLRRSSATLLADAGVDITIIKRHAGWKSTTVAEGYVENSIENKTKIANQILVGTTTSAIIKTVNECPEGVVHEDSFKEIYSKFFPHGNASLYAHYVFKAFDVNCNGAISFRDLLITLSTLLRGSVYERLRWTFKLYDVNGDGCISRGELSEIVVAVHELMGRRAHQVEDDRKAREQIDRVFRKLDLNQDGVITIEEFMESCLKDDVITRSLQMFDVVL